MCSRSSLSISGMAWSLAAAVLVGGLVGVPMLLAAERQDTTHQGHAAQVSLPSWAESLKGQTKVEDALEGRAGRSEKVELQHHRLMRQMEQQMTDQTQSQWTSGGYNGMSMMHQYMGQDGSSFLLMSGIVSVWNWPSCSVL